MLRAEQGVQRAWAPLHTHTHPLTHPPRGLGPPGRPTCAATPPRARAQEWHLRLMYMTYEALGVMRTREMFDIVVDYPDSLPAVRAVPACSTAHGGAVPARV